MVAASRRLEVSASNIANLESNGPLPGAPNAGGYPAAYAAQRVDQVDVAGGGTLATVTTASPGTVAGYDPTAPYADKNGMVAVPNVDLVNETLQQITAREDFQLNAKVIRVETEMMKALLDIKV
jgi:flagellar basal-body rod protein FlgC